MTTGRDMLIIGASGLVGSALLGRLAGEAVGTYATHAREGLVFLDVTDPASLDAVFAEHHPRVVVDCAAWTHVDGCEQDPERSRRVNLEGARNVAAACARLGARLVFFSTDYVFGDGRGPHALDEEPSPLNVYGRHKLEAERAVAAAIGDHAIIRSCNLYGYQPGGKNFVMAVLENGRAGRTMRVPADQWGSPTLAEDLVDAVAALARSTERGVFHLAGPDYVDRPTWARKAARAFGLDPTFIEPVPTSALGQAARRPLRAGLDSRSSLARLGMRFRGLDDGLRRVAEAARGGG